MNNKKCIYLIIVILIISSFIAFGRIVGNDFINFDDDRLITENVNVKSGFNAESIKWALTNARLEYWHPLTWLSIMLDWSLFGANASGHHLVSLLFHIGAVLFLFLFLNKATKQLWPSAFVAALFALHPLRVESVAWAAERKDVLSMFFGMATIYAYVYYVETHQKSKYFVCLFLFALSLMSKPTLVTLPCVLLLLDYWPLARWQKPLTPVNIPVAADKIIGKKKSKQLKSESFVEGKIAKPVQNDLKLIGNLLWEKVPFFFLALVFSVMLIWQLRADKYMVSVQHYPFSQRLMNAIVSYASYLGKTFWPVDLAVFYPYEHYFQMWQVLGAASVLLVISVAVFYLVKKAPFLAIGWCWYLGTLFPVIGLMSTGDQAMADRYTYFPSIGISLMLTWGILYLLPKENLRKIITIPAAIILAALTFLTWQQCGYWKNSNSIFSHALLSTKDNYLAHTNFGVTLAAEGKKEEAITHYREAIKIDPDNDRAYYNFGVTLAAEGKKEEAIAHYREAIRINPDMYMAHANLGNALAAQGKYSEAIAHYLAVIKINPNNYETHFNLANSLEKQGRVEEAIASYREVLRINPDHSSAHINLGAILGEQLKHDEALYHFRQALRMEPNEPGIYFSLGVALANTGKLKEAEDSFRQAIYLKPDYAEARQALKMVKGMYQ